MYSKSGPVKFLRSLGDTRERSSLLIGDVPQPYVYCRNTLTKAKNKSHHGYIDISKDLTKFCTGSTYSGQWNALGFSGFGTYTYPCGTIYEGNFKLGLFHGRGKISFCDGKAIIALFHKGNIVREIAVEVFGKIVHRENFKYCQMPDRRYFRQHFEELQPVGKENLTKDETPRYLPPNNYDIGNGVFNADQNIIFQDADPCSNIKRARLPEFEEVEKIKKEFRSGNDYNVGYIPHFYEKWFSGQAVERLFLEPMSEVETPNPPSPASISSSSDTTPEPQPSADSYANYYVDSTYRVLGGIESLLMNPDICGSPDSLSLTSVSETDSASSGFKDKRITHTLPPSYDVDIDDITYVEDYKEINEVAAKNIKSNEEGNEPHSSDMDENSSFLDDNEESQFTLDKDVDYDYYLSDDYDADDSVSL